MTSQLATSRKWVLHVNGSPTGESSGISHSLLICLYKMKMNSRLLEFETHVWVLLWAFGHEPISRDLGFLQFIQKWQLLVTGKRMCTKYWCTAFGKLAKEQYDTKMTWNVFKGCIIQKSKFKTKFVEDLGYPQ